MELDGVLRVSIMIAHRWDNFEFFRPSVSYQLSDVFHDLSAGFSFKCVYIMWDSVTTPKNCVRLDRVLDELHHRFKSNDRNVTREHTPLESIIFWIGAHTTVSSTAKWLSTLRVLSNRVLVVNMKVRYESQLDEFILGSRMGQIFLLVHLVLEIVGLCLRNFLLEPRHIVYIDVLYSMELVRLADWNQKVAERLICQHLIDKQRVDAILPLLLDETLAVGVFDTK